MSQPITDGIVLSLGLDMVFGYRLKTLRIRSHMTDVSPGEERNGLGVEYGADEPDLLPKSVDRRLEFV